MRTSPDSSDLLERTAQISGEELDALLGAPVTPFHPVSEIRALRPASPIPGAPWSGHPTPVPPALDQEDTAVELPAAAPAIVPRTRPSLPIVNATPFSPATIPWRICPPRDSLTVVVKGTFDLVPGAPARGREESEPPTGDLHLGGDRDQSLAHASDFAIWKPRADVTLVGHAHAPGGEAEAMEVRFAFGSAESGFDRRLVVLGDRRFRRGILGRAATPPAAFARMPLTWERAFGGAEIARNPLGKGHPSAGHVVHLPNLEDPSALIAHPDDAPAPICFAPVPPSFAERWSRLGTYDGRWLRTRWPYFPEDFDGSFFQSAPAPQQLAHLRGDEPYAIHGMDPDRPMLSGSLPGRRVRCFAQRTEQAGGLFVEIPMRLDTASFDADVRVVHLVWRGLAEVDGEEAADLAAILLIDEALDAEPATLAEARARLRAMQTVLDPVDAGLVEEPPPANDAAPIEANESEHDEDLSEDQRALLEMLEAAGLDAAAIDALPREAPPAPDPQSIARSLREAGAGEDEVAELLSSLEADLDEPTADSGRRPSARARVLAAMESGEPLDDEDLGGAQLSGLDLSSLSLQRARLDGADLSGCSLRGANLAGAQLGGADLRGADLEGADLTEADLTGARLDAANLAGAVLQAADLTGVSAEGATFRRATGEDAIFAGATLTGATFTDADLPSADLTGASLDGADFSRATLPEVKLYDAAGEGVRFDEAKMPEARADGLRLVDSSLRRVVAPGSIWEGAELDGCAFFGADLAGASFTRASLAGAVFSAADLRDARFRRARLAGAGFLKAQLRGASFERADLTGADLRGACLHGAATLGAVLEGVDLDQAILTRTKLGEKR